jgi:hypothetical protein
MSAIGGKADEINGKADIAIFVPDNATWNLCARLRTSECQRRVSGQCHAVTARFVRRAGNEVVNGNGLSRQSYLTTPYQNL